MQQLVPYKTEIYNNRALVLEMTIRSVALLAILAAIIISLTGCQNTPTTPPVTGKQNIKDIVKNNTQNTNALQGIPQTVTDTTTQGQVTLHIAAQTQLPDTAKMPVVTVQPERITQDTVDKVVKTFIKGNQLYATESVQTKDEVEKEYLLHQALQMNNIDTSNDILDEQLAINNVSTSSDDRNMSGSGISSAAAWQETIDAAPTTVQRQPISAELTDSNESDLVANGQTYKGFHGQVLYGVANLGTGYNANLKISSSDSARDCSIEFTNEDITTVYNKYTGITGNAQARGVKMTLDQAKTLAQQTLNAVGATGMSLSDAQLWTQMPLTAKDDPNTMNQAYGLWFTRDVNGMPTTLDIQDVKSADAESYPYERVFMLINDSGVSEFKWTSPLKVTNTLSSNAQTIPFNDVMSTFKNQFFIHYAQNDASKGNTTYNINRITLGMMRVQDKDQSNTYSMVPVWDFFGTASTTASGVTTNTDHTLESFLTINALDGSVIDRTQGY